MRGAQEFLAAWRGSARLPGSTPALKEAANGSAATRSARVAMHDDDGIFDEVNLLHD